MTIESRSDAAPIPIVLLFGPTGVGKTEILLELSSERIEVVNADSAQIYRRMDIGTAKPSEAIRARIPHHLIDIRDPKERFSVGDFVTLADRTSQAVSAAGAFPVVSGGTAFYLWHFLHGLPETPPSDSQIRNRLEQEAAERGLPNLYSELRSVDPPTASRLPAGDRYRILRALEVFRLTGRPLSSFPRSQALREGYRFLTIGLDRPRDELYRRIDKRVDAMFAAGLAREVEGLLAEGYRFEDPGLKAIGYREFEPYFAGESTIEETRRLIKLNTRHYAKRQLTFFRRLPGIHWFQPDARPRLSGEIVSFLR